MEKKKKVALFCNISYFPQYGGVENSIYHLAQEFRNNGYLSVIFVGMASGGAKERVSRHNHSVVVRFKFRSFENDFLNLISIPLSIADMLWILRKIKNKYNPSSVVSRNQFVSIFVSMVFNKNLYLAPGFAKYQQNIKNLQKKSNFFSRIWSCFKRIVHEISDQIAVVKADRLVVFSENMRKQVGEIAPKLNFKVELAKPGVDIIKYQPCRNLEEKKSLRKKINLPLNSRVVLGVGRLVSAKGFDLLIDSVQYLPHDVLVVIVGDGREYNYLSQKIKENSCSERVKLIGYSSNLASFYKSSDIYVMSSKYEPLGQTLLEAMACGIPTVSFAGGPDVINASEEILGDLGQYALHYTADSLASEINKVLNMSALDLKRLSEELVKRANSNFTWNSLFRILVRENQNYDQ